MPFSAWSAAWLGSAGSTQPNLVASQLLGLGIVRYVLGFEPIASLDAGAVVDLAAPSVQRSLTGQL
jgi:hypothetical protein